MNEIPFTIINRAIVILRFRFNLQFIYNQYHHLKLVYRSALASQHMFMIYSLNYLPSVFTDALTLPAVTAVVAFVDLHIFTFGLNCNVFLDIC